MQIKMSYSVCHETNWSAVEHLVCHIGYVGQSGNKTVLSIVSGKDPSDITLSH